MKHFVFAACLCLVLLVAEEKACGAPPLPQSYLQARFIGSLGSQAVEMRNELQWLADQWLQHLLGLSQTTRLKAAMGELATQVGSVYELPVITDSLFSAFLSTIDFWRTAKNLKPGEIALLDRLEIDLISTALRNFHPRATTEYQKCLRRWQNQLERGTADEALYAVTQLAALGSVEESRLWLLANYASKVREVSKHKNTSLWPMIRERLQDIWNWNAKVTTGAAVTDCNGSVLKSSSRSITDDKPDWLIL